MKKIVRFVVVFVFAGLSTIFSPGVKAQASLPLDSILMGASYANEVYYSMSNSTVLVTPRDQWDIAFRANIMSSSIIINDGTGVVLYTYPKSDTSGWANVDTSGLYGWTPMYNDPDDWENGAFSRNATGHPDYGWGIYNTSTHNLKGDSLFIIKLRNESFRKIWIQRKYSSANTYVFKYAFLDGSDEHQVTLDCMPYSTKDFVGYNLAMNVVVDFQPPKADWDLLFTKYMSVQPNGTPYPVTGVLQHSEVGVGKHSQVSPGFTDWGTDGFEFSRQVIGWDWKVFDMQSFTYICLDSLVYFVQDQGGDVYEMIFTKFAGSGSGKVVFGKGKVSLVGIDQPADQKELLSVYPNPASSEVNITLNGKFSEDLKVKITDILGKVVFENHFSGLSGNLNYSIPVHQWEPGLYIVTVNNNVINITKKLMVK